MMHLARFAGLHDETDGGPQALADQVVVDRGRGEERRNRDAARADQPVGEDDDVVAFQHGALGALAQPVDRHLHAFAAALACKGDVERLRLEMVVGDVADQADLLQVLIGEDRLAHFQALPLRGALQVEEVRPRSDEGDEAHHRLFADRVDRRVGDLREVLLEIVVEQLRLAREHGDGRVGAHRADRLLPGGRHRRHQDLEILLRVAESLLPIEKRGVGGRRARAHRRQVLKHDLRLAEPLLVGVGGGEPALQLVVVDDAPLFQVDEQHLAGLQPPLGDDLLLRHRQHADFRRHNHEAVVGDDVARRAKAVAIEGCADLAAVGEGDRRRAVPRLHQRGVIFVEGAPLVIHERVARPCFRDEHHRRVRELVTAHGEELERVVETGGVGLALIGDRPELLDLVAEERRGDGGLPRRHPVHVSAQRVDLAVMRHHPVGMGELPRREGVGGEALMHQRHLRDEARIVQVGIIGAELIGEEHALVDDRPRGHGDDVEAAVCTGGLLVDHA